MSSLPRKMTVIEEKIEISDEDVHEENLSDGNTTKLNSQRRCVYIAIQGNLSGTDSFIFGLDNEDVEKVVEIYPRESEVVTNGLCVSGSVVDVVNTLHRFGYVLVDVAGSTTKTWTMVKNFKEL